MSIAESLEALKQPTSKEVAYTPKTEFDGQSGFIQTGPLSDAPKKHEEILELFGYDPKEVQIVGNPRVSRWQTYDERWLSAYKFQLAPVSKSSVDDLVKIIGRKRPHKPAEQSGTGVFSFQASDMQFGKGHGTLEGILERFTDSLDVATKEYRQLRKRRNIGGINAMFPGDCIEGVVSQNGMNIWQTELTLTEQIRVLRRMYFRTIEVFAPLTDHLWFRTVNGNHDQATRVQNTRADDGYATEQAIAVADSLKLNESAYGHVVVEVPPIDQGWMTVQSFNSTFVIAHGHQWRRGKAMDWLANQALHATNVSAAQFMIHGHEHRWTVDTNSARTVICSPAYDMGSPWLQNGSDGLRGGLTYVTNGAELTDMRLV